MAFIRGDHAGARLRLATVLLTTATQAAVATILTALTATTLDGSIIHDLAIAVCVLDFVALAISTPICLFLVRSLSTAETRPRTFMLCAVSFVAFLVGCVLTIYALAHTWVEVLPDKTKSHGNAGSGLTIAGFAVWAVNTLLQIIVHLILIVRKPSIPSEPAPTQEVTERPSPRVRHPLSIHLKSIATPPFSRPTTAMTSPSLNGYLDSPNSTRSSFRHSIHQVIRPITSRTKLLRSPLPKSPEPFSPVPRRQGSSLDFGCRGDGFEAWDTSAVEEHFINPLSSSSVPPSPKFAQDLRKGSLAPIPGSRPVSPAKVLEGPFRTPDYQQAHSSSTHLPSSADCSGSSAPPTPTTTGPNSDIGPTEFPMPPEPLADPEAHIHPLFRSNSPTPAPSPSPGTVVEMEGHELPRRLGSVASSTRSAIGSRKGSVGQYQGRGPSALGMHVVMGEEEKEDKESRPSPIG